MTTTYLADMVAQIRIDLHDTDAGAYMWTDATLQRHIERALLEYSAANPLTAKLDVDATAGSHQIDLAGVTPAALADLTYRPEAIYAVEWPYDVTANPPNLVPFRVWASVLYILTIDTPIAGDKVRIYYHNPHTLSNSVKTLPKEDEALIQLGAGAYAALEMEAASTDKINLSAQAGEEYSSWGRRMISRFQKEIWYKSRRNAMETNPTATWDTSRI